MAIPIVRQRLSDVLVSKIHGLIVDRGLNPGDRLPTEQEMAVQFGVSRLAVREATKALGFLGIIDSSPRRGLTVGGFAFDRILPLLKVHPGSRNVTAEELIATRVVIETGVLPYLIHRMVADPGVYRRLHAVNENMLAATRLDQSIVHDIAFHKALLEESGLRTLMAFGELLEIFFHQFREDVTQEEWRSGAEHHRRILDLLRTGDLTEAVEQLRLHISNHTIDSPPGSASSLNGATEDGASPRARD
jgi:GntR family transcriptional regulator, transcriptional repressor for pyruvate dehydrogenase complex